MRYQVLKISLYVAIFCIATPTLAQDKDKDKKDTEKNIGTEVVNVVKPYTPTISDAFKIKQMPSLNDKETTQKKKINYSIFSFPVASTFTPAKGKAADVKKAKKATLYNTYVSLGLGNYNSAALDFYTSRAISRNETFDIALRHHSSQGGIDGVELDDTFFNTRLDLAYIQRERDLSWKAKAGYQHQIYNWYGLPSGLLTPAQIGTIDEQQTYHSLYLGADISMEDSYIKGGKIFYRRTFDAASSGENRFLLQPEFEVSIADELITTLVDVDYVGGKFDKNYAGTGGIDYSYFKLGIAPSLVILRDDLTVNLGAGIYYGLDSENSDSDFFIYPRITAQYRLDGDNVIAYGGIEGDLKQNSYYDFVQTNQFVSPTLGIVPTDQQYNGYLGIKGKLTSNVSYNLRGSYIAENNKALFQLNPFSPAATNEGYTYANSFGIVYDDVKTISVFGELNIDITSNFKFGVKGEYFNYSTDQQAEAWNLPDFKASVFADYQIDENWFAGTNIFYVGERQDALTIPAGISGPATMTLTSLDSYFDVNAHVGYRFNDRLSVFVKANNIANQDYQKWLNFPVQQFQIMAGATYKFDF